MTFPLINVEVINGASSGADAPVDVQNYTALPLARTTFGVPQIIEVRLAPASGFSPVRFGVHMVVTGLPPTNLAYPAMSLVAGKFGVAHVDSVLQVELVQSLQSSRFGGPATRFALDATSLGAPKFGAPSTINYAEPPPLRTARFGVGASEHRLTAASCHRIKFGQPSLQLDSMASGVQSLRPVHFGMPSLGAISMRARTLASVRFGRLTVDRGATC